MLDTKNVVNENKTRPVFYMGISLVILLGYFYLQNNGLNNLFQKTSPQGQSLFILSKLTALSVYVLMWWQIMLGIFKRLNTRHHITLGVSVLLLVLTHVVLFVSASSLRQEELTLGMLLPDFNNGYYQTGVSLGVIALLLIFIAATSGALKNRLPGRWKVGHGLVYLTFLLATIHGVMIGSDMASKSFSFLASVAVLSLLFAFIYKQKIKV